MHEMSLAEGVLTLLETQAQQQNFKRVKQVWLRIGALAGVEVSSLTFCLDVVLQGSLADGAVVHVLHEAGRGWCLPCGEAVTVANRFDACPKCGGYQIQITGGDEMQVVELEVDTWAW